MRKGVKTRCTECDGIMEKGLLADQGHGKVYTIRWIDSPPETNIWTGKLKNENVIPITAYRCADCGFVKLYARDDE